MIDESCKVWVRSVPKQLEIFHQSSEWSAKTLQLLKPLANCSSWKQGLLKGRCWNSSQQSKGGTKCSAQDLILILSYDVLKDLDLRWSFDGAPSFNWIRMQWNYEDLWFVSSKCDKPFKRPQWILFSWIL